MIAIRERLPFRATYRMVICIPPTSTVRDCPSAYQSIDRE